MIQQNRKIYTEISPRLEVVLRQVVDDVIGRLGCVGALVTTLESDNGLYVRASAFDLSATQLKQILKPDTPAYLNNSSHQYNLGVSAVNGVNGTGQTYDKPYLVSETLYDILRPFAGREVADQIQADLDIKQVVAVPLMVRDEAVGSLLAAANQEFSDRDIDSLIAFGHVAAASIQSQHRLTAMEALERIILLLQAKMTDETEVLQAVVDAVVYELGYKGAMVATLEEGNALPVRAYALDEKPQLLTQLEEKAGVRLIGPEAVVYLDNESFKNNLSVRAVNGIDGYPQKYLTSSRLHDLLRPIVDKKLANFAQSVLGIRQVIAVPFFIEDEIVGNLFVASRHDHFSAWETSILTTFGQQAAAGIRNARLYREADKQRQIAEMFSRMAFSATASVHSLSNHLSAIRTYVHLLSTITNFPPSQQQEIMDSSPVILERLRRATDMLGRLHEPWQQTPDQPVSVNDCLTRAIHEAFPELAYGQDWSLLETELGIHIHSALAANLPHVSTAPDMLTEACRVLIRNAREAIQETGRQGDIWLSSEQVGEDTIKIVVRDNGVGIRPQDLPHVFEMGWSNKTAESMGFALFWTKDYVHGLGGRIEVESEWEAGTSFCVQLPVISQ